VSADVSDSRLETQELLHVLLVEDNDGDVLLVEDTLEQEELVQFVVTRVDSLAGAEAALREQRPDLVVLDMHLPDAAGLNGLRRLRSLVPEIPVVVLSGASEGLGRAAVREGAQDFLSKDSYSRRRLGEAALYAVQRNSIAQTLRSAMTSIELRARLLDAVGQAVVATDLEGNLVYYNAKAADLYGLDDLAIGEDLAARLDVELDETTIEAMDDTLERGEPWVGEMLVRRAAGPMVPVLVTRTTLNDPSGQPAHLVSVAADLTERKAAELELTHQALHDSLTGLPNRTLFFDRLSQAVARADRAGTHAAVLFVDVDNFKLINDSYGHLAGDEVLIALSQLLQAHIRPYDTLARLSGDEFGVVCESFADPREAIAVAERIRKAFAAPFGIAGHQLHVTVSIGVAATSGERATADGLLQDADVALYRAKERGRDRVELFDDELRARAQRRMLIEEALRSAPDQLSVHYQPQVELTTGRLTGFEALARWTHPTLGRVGPDEFIPIAEQSDLILGIGRYVLHEATAQLATWEAAHPELHLKMAVNLSSRQLTDDTLVAVVRDAVRAAGIDPSSLCLEITESVVMEDAAASVTVLQALKALGVRLAIDDFGTGYSSLAYLKRFPVDFLKVDRTFVAGVGRAAEDTVIVASVIDLARSLGLDVIAEGVESETQLSELAELGCGQAQGFLWSPALPGADAGALIGLAAGQQGILAEAPMATLGSARQRRANHDDILLTLTHELRTPITVIRGFAETLAQFVHTGQTDVLQSALDAITRQTDGMESLLSALAEARQLDEGLLRLDRRRFDLGDLVADAVNDLAAATPAHHLHFTAESAAPVDADPDRIRQVLTNLVTNAAKFAPEGTRIDVIVRMSGADAELHVVDRGPGVPASRVGELFRKFSRLGSNQRGTGLGLYIARQVVRSHAGTLIYRRADTGGAEFVVGLPVAG
jgi:diguanylate cyclase (GGDEF)-like protein/PAS domain S-box-containing protein